jgi:hypothetical protein
MARSQSATVYACPMPPLPGVKFVGASMNGGASAKILPSRLSPWQYRQRWIEARCDPRAIVAESDGTDERAGVTSYVAVAFDPPRM